MAWFCVCWFLCLVFGFVLFVLVLFWFCFLFRVFAHEALEYSLDYVQVRNRLLLRLVFFDGHACVLPIHFPASTNLWNDLARAMKALDGKKIDLGSLRPGGATWLLHRAEQPELVRRRGRWLSARTMEIYLEEVLVTTFEEKISPKTRALIHLCAGGYAVTLERIMAFLECGIPPVAWYYLLRGADGFERDIGKNGDDGEKSTSHANSYRQRAHTTSSQGGKKEERLPDFRLPIGRCQGSSPHPCTAPIPFCTSEW